MKSPSFTSMFKILPLNQFYANENIQLRTNTTITPLLNLVMAPLMAEFWQNENVRLR